MKKYLLLLCILFVLIFSVFVFNSQAQWFPPPYIYSPSMLLPVYPICNSGLNFISGYGTLPLLPYPLLNATRFSKIAGSPSKTAPTTTTAIPYSSFYFPTTIIPTFTLTTSYFLYNVNFYTSLYYFPPTTTSAYGTLSVLNSAIPFPFP